VGGDRGEEQTIIVSFINLSGGGLCRVNFLQKMGPQDYLFINANYLAEILLGHTAFLALLHHEDAKNNAAEHPGRAHIDVHEGQAQVVTGRVILPIVQCL